MKKIIYTLSIVLGLAFSANAQIQSLAGPRIGTVFITSSPVSSFLNGKLKLEDFGELPANYDEIAKGNLTTLYGWQWESRFADAGNVTGIVEWVALVAGMEKGKFLPSVSSMVGARTKSGLEFAVGPNLSMGGIAMVFGVGYNFKSGELNIPVNIAFVPGKTLRQEAYTDGVEENTLVDPDGISGSGDEYMDSSYTQVFVPAFDYQTGNRFSITVGFNLTK